MPNKHLIPKLTLVALSLINVGYVAAEPLSLSNPEAYAPYNPRITGQFLGGGNQQLGGFLDAMVPVWQQPDELFFADASAMFGQRGRATYSGGLGFRQMYNQPASQGIVGGYTFIDYYRTTHRNMFWQLNPGLEWLTTQYEARLQAYIPISDKKQAYARTLASTLPANVLQASGLQNSYGATGHRLFDTHVNLVEQVGTGAELEVGRHFNLGSSTGAWVRVGAYHYNFKGISNINGAQANVEIGINPHLSLLLQNNYDNQNKNRFAVGLRANFGGADAPANTLAHRMQAPIIRHQARQSYGEKDPIRLNYQASSSFNTLTNAWFFSPNGTQPAGENTTRADCTAEGPCSTIDSPTADRIQALAPGANLLFETGDYLIPTDARNEMGWVNLQDGQSVLGRNPGWFTPSTDSNRPTINGGLFWGDDSTGTIANGYLDRVVINNNNQTIPQEVLGIFDDPAVIAAGATGNILVQNSELTATYTVDSSFTNITAIGVYSGKRATVKNSNLTASATSKGVAAIADGVRAFNAIVIGSTQTAIATGAAVVDATGINAFKATVTGSTQTATATSESDFSFAIATGIRASNTTVTGSTQTASVTLRSGDANARGILAASDTGKVTITGSTQTATATSESGSADAKGIYALNGATVTGGTQSATATAEGDASASGIESEGDGPISVTDSTQTATATTTTELGLAYANGILARNDDLTVTRSAQTSTATSGSVAVATGIFALNGATVTGSTQTATANAGSGNAEAKGIDSEGITTTLATVTGSLQTATATSESGDAFATGIFTLNRIAVTGSTQIATANSGPGMAIALGIESPIGISTTVNGSTQTATANSGSGDAGAAGILVNNDVTVTVTGSTHSAIANSTMGTAQADGIAADAAVVVDRATIQAIAIADRGAEANGVNAPSGTVENSIIMVLENEIPVAKCTAGIISDGSCT